LSTLGGFIAIKYEIICKEIQAYQPVSCKLFCIKLSMKQGLCWGGEVFQDGLLKVEVFLSIIVGKDVGI
jgi:hypothetical protein